MNLQEDIFRIKEVMGINEGATDIYLKRRLPEILMATMEAAKYYKSSYFTQTFDQWLNTSIYAGIIKVIPSDFSGQNPLEMSKMEDLLKNKISNDKELFDKFQRIYTGS